jgi:hypothetical protein
MTNVGFLQQQLLISIGETTEEGRNDQRDLRAPRANTPLAKPIRSTDVGCKYSPHPSMAGNETQRQRSLVFGIVLEVASSPAGLAATCAS